MLVVNNSTNISYVTIKLCHYWLVASVYEGLEYISSSEILRKDLNASASVHWRTWRR